MAELNDLVDRISGAVKAAQGMREKIDLPTPTEPAAAPPPKEEDMEAFRKVVADMKGQVDALHEKLEGEEKKKAAAQQVEAPQQVAAHASGAGSKR